MRTNALIAAFAMLVASGQAAAAGDAAAGESKAVVCVACHGVGGNSINPEWPKLSGQNARYLAKQILDLKAAKARTNPLMAPMIANLNGQDIEDIAAYYASRASSGGFASEARVELGEKLYRGGVSVRGVAACMGCHGPAGRGNPLGGFPVLSGQHAKYVEIQLKAFRAGTRSNDRNGMMQDAARFLTDEEIMAVSEYVAGLH